MMKRGMALVLALVLLVLLCPASFAEPLSISSAAEIMQVIQSARDKTTAAITLSRVVLNSGGKESPAYLLMLDGTLNVNVNVNNSFACVLSSFNLDTFYLCEAKKVLQNHVPAGSKLLLAGYSLGGMIAQQLASDAAIKTRYEIINTLTCGSPVVLTGACEGSIHRLAAKTDVIPKLGIAYIFKGDSLFTMEKSSKGIRLFDVHGSYKSDPVWASYDVLGVKGGSSHISFVPGATEYFCEIQSKLIRSLL